VPESVALHYHQEGYDLPDKPEYQQAARDLGLHRRHGGRAAAYKPYARNFTVDVRNHGFEHIDPRATEIPDHVISLAKLPQVDVPLHAITVAAQSRVDPDLVEHYRQHPPRPGTVIVRPYGDDAYAVVDGHHSIIGHRLRGDQMIKARLLDDQQD
jgi:hypothetical protein